MKQVIMQEVDCDGKPVTMSANEMTIAAILFDF